MEYFIGSIATVITIIVLNKVLNNKPRKKVNFAATQSQLYKVMSEITFRELEKQSRPTQSSKYLGRNYIKIMVLEDKAYWIKNNQLYSADFDGQNIVEETTKEVDTMTMNAVELEHTMFVVEKLTEEENNDYRS